QRVDLRALGGGEALFEVVLAEFVHQEPDRAEIHPVDRLGVAEEAVQRLQHEAVAAQRHDDVAILLAGVGVAGAHELAGGHRGGRLGGDEMDLRHQPPVSDMARATAGVLWRRSMRKSWPLGLRAMASSMAAASSASLLDARRGARRSAASSWPR